MTEAQLQQRRNNVVLMAHIKRTTRKCSKGHNVWMIDHRGNRCCIICKRDSDAECRERILTTLQADPTDKRHGTSWGYTCGCRCFKCRIEISRLRKLKPQYQRRTKEDRAAAHKRKLIRASMEGIY